MSRAEETVGRPMVIRERAELLARAERLMSAGARRVLGIAGPPGAGKSTLASWLESALRARHGADPLTVTQVPMDGFHLPNATLVERGLRDRKGAPDTFDATAYVALLELAHDGADRTLHAPTYSRDLHEPVPDTHPIPPSVTLVISEGNYLLLGEGAWRAARPLFDETWFVAVDRHIARERLIERQIAGGRSPRDAQEWVDRNDMRNADIVDATAGLADVRVELQIE